MTIDKGQSVTWQLLGGPEVLVDGAPLNIQADRVRAVMFLLVLHAGQRVPTERLIDALWPDHQPKTARNSIQRFVADLRRLLGPAADRVTTTGDGYQLLLQPGDTIDVDEAEHGVRQGRRFFNDGDAGRALSELKDLAEEPIEPLQRLYDVHYLAVDRVRLNDLVNEVLQLRASSQLALSDLPAAVLTAQQLIDRDPHREQAWADLILAKYRQGRVGDALASYNAFRAMLIEDLGCDPSPRLQDLEAQILTHDPRLTLDLTKPLSAGEQPAGDLIGRDEDVQNVIAQLEQHQVVSIIGPGGVGKTALAEQVASMWTTSGLGQPRSIRLESVSTGGFVGAIGEVVGISSRFDEDSLLEVLDRLRADTPLLVLDNCEHLVPTVQAFLSQLHQHAPNVKVLCTSRVRLAVDSETVVQLSPLTSEQCHELFDRFVQRSGIRLDPDTQPLKAELCDHLDGLPLAIELAASALQGLGLAELIAQTVQLPKSAGDDSLHERDRHSSIEVVLQSSLDLLDPPATRLLYRCATFEGDFDLQALVAICSDDATTVIGNLAQLVRHSLVQLRRQQGQARYRLLVPIRLSLLGRAPAPTESEVRAFVQYFVARAESGQAKLGGSSPIAGIEDLRQDLGNMREAFDRADELDDVGALTRMATAFGVVSLLTAEIHAHSTLRDWSERLHHRLESCTDEDVRPDITNAIIACLYGCGGWNWIQQIKQFPIPTDPAAAARIGFALYATGDVDLAWRIFDGLDIAAIEDPLVRVQMANVGSLLAFQKRSLQGFDLVKLAVDTAANSTSPAIVFHGRMAEALKAYIEGDAERCQVIMSHLLEGIQGHGLGLLEQFGRGLIAITSRFMDQGPDPIPLLLDVMNNLESQNGFHPVSAAFALDLTAAVLFDVGQPNDAARLLGMLSRLNLRFGLLLDTREAVEHEVRGVPELRRHYLGGQESTTTEVVRLTRDALAAAVDARDAA